MFYSIELDELDLFSIESKILTCDLYYSELAFSNNCVLFNFFILGILMNFSLYLNVQV